MPTLLIDDREITVDSGITVLQACEELGIEIPRFCYHDRLSIAGNCRMCLVEMEKSLKPIASCAMPVADGMVIRTDTLKVKKAREGVMEFLLINHPLDCPICDQGGECDLQDQAMGYGLGISRFDENKRAVAEKNLGPLIKTVMNRCIHCTRCIRFATEIAGVEDLGATFRGEETEITTYVEASLASELSGNLVDVCPVGALTSKPYAFVARPWELNKVETIDVHDAIGSNIRVDVRGREVMRVLPRLHEDINEEWLSDRSRYAIDGLRKQRLDRPYVRRQGVLEASSWQDAFDAIAARLSGLEAKRVAAITGDLVDAEAIFAMRDLMLAIGTPNIDCRQDGARVGTQNRGDYIFNTSISGIEDVDALLIVGSNPRWEASLVNARIRKRWLTGQLKVGLIGHKADLTYSYDYLGSGPEALTQVLEGTHDFCKILNSAERPAIIVGMGALVRSDGGPVYNACRKIADGYGMVADGWNGFNILHTAASRVAGLDLGFLPGEGGQDVAGILGSASKDEMKVIWLLGADEIDMSSLGTAFVVYQGHHGDSGAHRADVILPSEAYTEADGTWVNIEGRPQRSYSALYPPGDARPGWSIIRAFSEVIGKTLPYNDLTELRAKMVEVAPHLADIDEVKVGAISPTADEGAMASAPFLPIISDYYLSNVICRASEVMADCSRLYNSDGKVLHTDD